MKRKVGISVAIIALIGTFWACSKIGEHNIEPKVLEQKLDYSKWQAQGFASRDFCSGHGGTVGGGISWTVATCKSKCSSGIGFRCGSDGWVKCSDGAIVVVRHHNTKCTNLVQAPQHRQMNSEYVFYENNTLKWVFLNAMPEEEIGNNIFEIEEDDIVPLPDFLSIGGTVYSGYKVFKGNYEINYEDGEYGSVTIPIELVE